MLRSELQQVSSVIQLEAVSERHLAWVNSESAMAAV